MSQQISNLPRSTRLRHAGKTFGFAWAKKTQGVFGRWQQTSESLIITIHAKHRSQILLSLSYGLDLNGLEVDFWKVGMDYDAVIFDKDGVLLDSMSNGFKWADEMRIEMARDLGKDIDMEESKILVKASKVEELEEAVEETGLGAETIRDMEEEIAKRKIEKMKNGDIQLFRDTKEVLKELERKQIPKSVVSNAPEQTTRFTVKNFDLEKHFEKVLSPPLDDIHEFVRLKKPSPHMLEDAIDAMDASNPVMVGDSDDDIEAAKNVGIDSIFVNTNGGTDLDPTHKVQRLKRILDLVR